MTDTRGLCPDCASEDAQGDLWAPASAGLRALKRLLTALTPPRQTTIQQLEKHGALPGAALDAPIVLHQGPHVAMTVIPNPDGQPVAAVSISAISSRISGKRLPELVGLLEREIRSLAK